MKRFYFLVLFICFAKCESINLRFLKAVYNDVDKFNVTIIRGREIVGKIPNSIYFYGDNENILAITVNGEYKNISFVYNKLVYVKSKFEFSKFWFYKSDCESDRIQDCTLPDFEIHVFDLINAKQFHRRRYNHMAIFDVYNNNSVVVFKDVRNRTFTLRDKFVLDPLSKNQSFVNIIDDNSKSLKLFRNVSRFVNIDCNKFYYMNNEQRLCSENYLTIYPFYEDNCLNGYVC